MLWEGSKEAIYTHLERPSTEGEASDTTNQMSGIHALPQ